MHLFNQQMLSLITSSLINSSHNFTLEGAETDKTEERLRYLVDFAEQEEGGAWGLELGKRIRLESLGHFGYAATSAPTFMHFLEMINNFGEVSDKSFDLSLVKSQEYVELRFVPLLNTKVLTNAMSAYVFSAMYEQLKAVCFGYAEGVEFHFMNSRPQQLDCFQKYLGDHLFFGATEYCMRIPRQYCDQPSSLYNKDVWNLALQECKKQYEVSLYNAENTDILEAVKTQLENAIEHNLRNKPTQGTLPISEDVARNLGISDSRMRKYLRKEGASFKSVKEELRKKWCMELLQFHKYSIDAIGSILGYQDSSNFTRACRRWFGTTPGAIRELVSQES